MRSLRSRLLALWLMLAVSGVVTGLLLIEFYRQSTNAQVGRAEETVARACRQLADRYQFFVTGWRGGGIDDALKQQLVTVVQTALRQSPGVEGGIWQGDAGSLAYAFPTYEGTGPKTDLPVAELSTIRGVNAEALRESRPGTVHIVGRSQVLVVHACPLRGPFAAVTGWTMMRAFAGGRAYNQLLIGLAILALTVVGSAIWLARILYLWSRQIARLETELAARDPSAADLPALARTGEREFDRLVDALNATGARLANERRRSSAAERLAAVGRLAAGLAHEIRNPIAAMRLKAENALAADADGRRIAALQSILQQVGRLDGLLRDLLAMTQRREPKLAEIDLAAFLELTAETHRELAATKGVKVVVVEPAPAAVARPLFDAEQMHRALDNLVLNAIENTPAGGSIEVVAEHCADKLRLRVRDTGRGVPDNIRERLFEPFVTGRAEGTGLGLALVREIARAHGGEARLVPTSQGAEFEIEMPWRTS